MWLADGKIKLKIADRPTAARASDPWAFGVREGTFTPDCGQVLSAPSVPQADIDCGGAVECSRSAEADDVEGLRRPQPPRVAAAFLPSYPRRSS